jgi:hypothetical protein
MKMSKAIETLGQFFVRDRGNGKHYLVMATDGQTAIEFVQAVLPGEYEAELASIEDVTRISYDEAERVAEERNLEEEKEG